MVKKILLLFVTIFLFFVLPFQVLAQSDTGWVIDNFESEIRVNKDTTVEVKETIQVDFGSFEKHGIFRTIPVKYKTESNNNLDIRFKLLSVTDEKGRKIDVENSRDGDNIKLKIGDANRLITGKNTYVISYQVQRVITTLQEEAELYWNVTGNAWPVPILSTKAIVKAPEDSVLNTICFTGLYGSTSENCLTEASDSEVTITSQELSTGEGLTIAVMLDKEKFIFPSSAQKTIWFLTDNWIFLTPLFVFLLMLNLYWKKGRDKEFKHIISEEGEETVPLFSKLNAVMAFSPPKDLSPGEVGVLADEKVHNRDVTAIVIDLARRGFFKIKEEKKGIFRKSEFTFTLSGKDEHGLQPFEKSVLDMLFSESRNQTTSLNKLHKNSYKHLSEIKSGLYEHLSSRGYFASNPQSVRTTYLVFGIGLIFIGFFIAPVLGIFTSVAGMYFAIMTAALIIIIFSFFMPARTPKGRKALEQIAGLKEYLRVGAWRQKIYEKQNFFEEALAFTIVFGMADKFIKAFKDADIKNLDWYQSSGTINAVAFSNSMNSLSSSVSVSAAGTAPKSASSGGSGFSGGGGGGGFGGGGGGSW